MRERLRQGEKPAGKPPYKTPYQPRADKGSAPGAKDGEGFRKRPGKPGAFNKPAGAGGPDKPRFNKGPKRP